MPSSQSFDVTTEKGIQELDTHLQSRSYVEGWKFSNADKECFQAFAISPDPQKYPNVFRWYLHIASLLGIRFLPVQVPPVRRELQELFADHTGKNLLRESRAEMIARVKQEVRKSMGRASRPVTQIGSGQQC